MNAKNYYQLLGVDNRASKETLQKAFRARIVDVHPDLHPDSNIACEQTRLLVEAYRELTRRRTRTDCIAHRGVPVTAACHEVGPVDGQWTLFTRQFAALILAGLVVVLLAWAVRVTAASRIPVYRFQFVELCTHPGPSRVALLVEPSIQSGVEWYQTVDYRLANASEIVTRQTTDVYLSAARDAEKRGDRASSDFYKASLLEIRRAQTAGVSF